MRNHDPLRLSTAEVLVTLFFMALIGGGAGYLLRATHDQPDPVAAEGPAAEPTANCLVTADSGHVSVLVRGGVVFCYVHDEATELCTVVAAQQGNWVVLGDTQCPL